MYYEYWCLSKPPFDNVPDPTMYVDSHVSMENAIAETLFAIEEGGESIAVIVGDVGLGKTLSLRMIIDSLDQEKYKIALITNPSITFAQLTKEIIGQLTGKPYAKTRKVDLLETFNKILFQTIDQGKKVLILIDEANAISPANLENLRLLTNMQDDYRNLFTMVLCGQTELAKRLEDPRRANLFQRVGTYNTIEKIDSEELVKTYVETRLTLAGGTKQIFNDDVFGPLWRLSEGGVPRLINKICKLCLKAGETNGLEAIPAELVDQIGQRFQRSTGPVTQRRKPRKIFGREMAGKKEEPAAPEAKEVAAEPVIPIPVPEPVAAMPAPAPEPVDAPEPVPPVEATHPAAEERMEEREQPPLVAQSVEPEEPPAPVSDTAPSEENQPVEIEIGEVKATVDLPFHVVRQAQSSTREHRVKLAGVLAARFLQQHPQFTASVRSDPVELWSKVRESLLNRFEDEKQLGVM